MLNTCTMCSYIYAICTFEAEMPTQRLVCTSTHTHTHLICMYLIVYSFVVCNVKSAHVLVFVESRYIVYLYVWFVYNKLHLIQLTAFQVVLFIS